MDLDLFHQEELRDGGYYAITDFTGNQPETKVYTPEGEYCGSTNATGRASRLAAIRQIIKTHRVFNKLK